MSFPGYEKDEWEDLKKGDELVYIGDIVIYRKKQATVVFGPFEKNYKQVYELQMEDGSVVSAISDSIRKQ